MRRRGGDGRGTALLVGLLLTVTVSLLALSLLLGTADRQRRRADPLGVETLLQADGAARVAQLDLAAPGRGTGETSRGRFPDGSFETERPAPVLTGLSRGRGDLRVGARAGWGEVWSQRVAARRSGEARGRALDLRLVRPAVPAPTTLRLAIAGGLVRGYSTLPPAAGPAWESPGTEAILVPAAADGLYLRAGLAGYEAFRAGSGRTPLALVVHEGEVRAVDGPTGRPLFALTGAARSGAPAAEAPASVAPFTGDAVLGTGPCPPTGPLAPGCAWRTVALASVGRTLFALDLTSPLLAGAPPVLWKRDLDAPVTGAVFGRLRGVRPEGGFAALVTTGARLLTLDLATGTTLETEAVRGALALSAPAALDLDGDAWLDTLYAADDTGRLWRFDLVARGDPVLRAEAGRGAAGGLAPAVLRAGIDPGTGEDRLTVAWVSAGADGTHVSAFLDTPSRPGEPVSRPPVLALDAPRLAACGELGAVRPTGWSMELRPRERAVSSLVVLDGFLHLATGETCGGDGGCAVGTVRGRLYRLDALNGDPCGGVSCCGRSPAASTRGAALGRAEPEPGALGSVEVVPDEQGRPAIFVARASGGFLVAPAVARPSITAWREAPEARW